MQSQPGARNRPVIALALLGVAAAVAYFALHRGALTSCAFAQVAPAAPAAAGPSPAAVPAAPAAPAAPPAVSPLPGLTVEGEEAVVQKGPPLYPSRRDPLKPFLPPPLPPVPPPPPEVLNILPPEPLQEGGIRPYIKPGSIAARPARRVAGIMWGLQPAAILILKDHSFVVRPGDTVNGERVIAISREAVYVRDAEGRRWEVKMEPSGRAGGSAASPTLPAPTGSEP